MTASLGVFAAVVTMVACNPNQPPPAPPPSSLARAAPERLGSTMMQPSDQEASPAHAVASSPTERAAVSEDQLAALDDAHLAGLVQAANDGAIRIARVGESRVADHAVKRFAHEVATSHLAADSRLRARLSELAIESAGGPVSEQVRTDVGGDLVALAGARGQDFDRAYVEGQLRDLAWAAELVGRVAGHVRSTELREAFEGLRAKLDASLRRAQALREAVIKGTTNWRPDAYDPDKVQR